MKKQTDSFAIENAAEFKYKMLNWLRQFNIFCFLDNNNYNFEAPSFECLLAVGCSASISLSNNNLYSPLKRFTADNPGWLFGHFSYPSSPGKPEQVTIEFEDGFFFVPAIVIRLTQTSVCFELSNIEPEKIFKSINAQSTLVTPKSDIEVFIKNRYTRNEYLDIIASLKKHIQRGDCYEINFCQDFYADNVAADPYFLYQQLCMLSPTPFAAFYRLNDKFCMCASPERFLKKTGDVIISQPIKGTSKRDPTNADTDQKNKNYLTNSQKERAENVMIVDLTRNDLSRICLEGSVYVKELFGVYSFPQVHQLISTVAGKVSADLEWPDIINACFPMGSMTGAPKIKVMELINRYEILNRNLFSGTIGYIDPKGDFDFNVIIRSLFYDETKRFLSFMAGSAITFYSNAEDEYNECMLKATALKKVLENNSANS